MDRKDLKIQALLEKISNLTTAYESQAADYRVELTMLSDEATQLRNEVEDLRKQLEPTQNTEDAAEESD